VRQAADPPGRRAASVSIRELVALCAPGRIASSLDGVILVAELVTRAREGFVALDRHVRSKKACVIKHAVAIPQQADVVVVEESL